MGKTRKKGSQGAFSTKFERYNRWVCFSLKFSIWKFQKVYYISYIIKAFLFEFIRNIWSHVCNIHNMYESYSMTYSQLYIQSTVLYSIIYCILYEYLTNCLIFPSWIIEFCNYSKISFIFIKYFLWSTFQIHPISGSSKTINHRTCGLDGSSYSIL